MIVEIAHPVPLPDTFPLYGDETLSVLAVALSSIAVGTSELRGVPDSPDIALLTDALRHMGVPVERRSDLLTVRGVGRTGLQRPGKPLRTGDSGLVLRVLTGLACGIPGETVIEAEGRLARRTLVRMIEPLAEMGVHVASTYKHTPPLHVFGISPVRPVHMEFPLPNFYLKLTLLLAALFAEEESVLTEPTPSTAHLEHLLTCADVRAEDGRYRVEIAPQDIEPFGRDTMPMDAAVADLLIVVSALRGLPCRIADMPVSPTRASVAALLQQHSPSCRLVRTGSWNNEAGELVVDAPLSLPSRIGLHGDETRRMKTALPMIAALCAGLPVELVVRDALDVRQQHCDWIAALVDGLTGFGAAVEERDDGFVLRGTGALQGAGVACYDDEAIALAMLAPALTAGDDTVLYDVPDTPRIRHCLQAFGLGSSPS